MEDNDNDTTKGNNIIIVDDVNINIDDSSTNNNNNDDDDDDNNEYQPLTPRYSAIVDGGSSTGNNNNNSNKNATLSSTIDQNYHHHQQRTSSTSMSLSISSYTASQSTTTGTTATTSTSSSHQRRRLLQPYSFDDMGRASTYLQFFKNHHHQQHQHHHHPHTTSSSTQQQQQQPTPTAPYEETSDDVLFVVADDDEEKDQKENVHPAAVAGTVSSNSTNSTYKKDNARSTGNSNKDDPTRGYHDRNSHSTSSSGPSNTSSSSSSSSSLLFGTSIASNTINNTSHTNGTMITAAHSTTGTAIKSSRNRLVQQPQSLLRNNEYCSRMDDDVDIIVQSTRVVGDGHPKVSSSPMHDDDDKNNNDKYKYDGNDDDDDDDDDMYSAWNDLPTTTPNKRHDKDNEDDDDDDSQNHTSSSTTRTAVLLLPWIIEIMYILYYCVQQIGCFIYTIYQQYKTHYHHKQQNKYDLSLLQQQHRMKIQQLFKQQQHPYHPYVPYNNINNNIEQTTNYDTAEYNPIPSYDFVLILQPQAVYSFWSEILDFRQELLGSSMVQYMDEQWMIHQQQIQFQQQEEQQEIAYSSNHKVNDVDNDDDDSMIAILGQYPSDCDDSNNDNDDDQQYYPNADTSKHNTSIGDDSEIVHDMFIDDDDYDIEANRLHSQHSRPKTPHQEQHIAASVSYHTKHTIRNRRIQLQQQQQVHDNKSIGTSSSSSTSSCNSNKKNHVALYTTPQNLYRYNSNSKNYNPMNNRHTTNNKSILLSPGLYSYLDKSSMNIKHACATSTMSNISSFYPPQNYFYCQKSLFERALESPPPLSTASVAPFLPTAESKTPTLTATFNTNDTSNTNKTPQTIHSIQKSVLQYSGAVTPVPSTPIQYTDHLNSVTKTTGLLGNHTLTPASSVFTTGTKPINITTTKQPGTATHYPRKFGNPNLSTTAPSSATTLDLKPRMKKLNQQIATMISPPVRSLLTLSSMMGSGPAQQQMSENQSLIKPVRNLHNSIRNMQDQMPVEDAHHSEDAYTKIGYTEQKRRNTDPNTIDMEDIHNPVIARGIASRTSRTNGMYPFLQALRDGIVVRRHRPGQEATFCKVVSLDGGDTIILQTISKNEAMIAFKVQRERFATFIPNGTPNLVVAQHWSFDDTSYNTAVQSENVPHNFNVPNYVAASNKRSDDSYNDGNPTWTKSIMQKFSHVTAQKVGTGRQRSINISNVVTIHPGQKMDPRSENSNDLGTSTIRRSKSEYDPSLSFSVVLLSRQLSNSNIIASKREYNTIEEKVDETRKDSLKMKEYTSQWYDGQGSNQQFRYLDFEAASESDYWFIIRGLLFLHRDALVGRYAKHRSAGIGTNGICNRLHIDEFHEPHTVGWLERTIVDVRKLDKMYMKGFVTKDDAVPPPSDYFLGFRSPGTSIWSRLRQAGLETQRLYSLDPNRVMIKVRCPIDRLLDVAEVLRINVKVKDGSFAPFREDMIEEYDSMIDPLEDPSYNMMSMQYHNQYLNFQFRSSIRQTIIDFIIGSRIRDSGAELGQTTDLGQKIQARVPLHMHVKLNAIFTSWFYFWRVENWSNGRDGRSLTHLDPQFTKNSEMTLGKDEKPPPNNEIPNIFTRIAVGSMYQPLDSIEAYFGEKVAFYFTWLQHTATHLVFLSIAGLILFIFQLTSGTIDHPLRPIFSIVVMIWTFIVLINWKKRANYMAFRWGTMNYKEQETTRPQFKGDYTQDEITGEWIVTYPKWKRWLKYCISFPLTLLFTMGTLVLILWVHANRDLQLAKYFSADSTGTGHTKIDFDEFAFSAIGRRAPIQAVELSKENLRSTQFWFLAILLPSMLGLFLPLLNFLLMRISILLNDFENYRTESEYRTYLIIKVFSFRFVCYFATLYYYSVISIGDDTSTDGGQQSIDNGILRVATGVLVYTTVAQWWQSFVHVCFPMLIGQLRMNHRNQRLADELRALEVEEAEIYHLSKTCFDDTLKERQVRLINKRLLIDQAQDPVWIELLLPTHDSFPEYIQAVVQFIFVSCFSVVLPLTPLIVLFNYLISMRLDAYKLCRGRRRPIAEKTGGIGVWEHVLHIVAVISVLTNCWLMGFTSSQFYWLKEHITDVGLFAVIVIWEHIMLLIKYIMTTSISSLPKTVRDAMKREQYELNKQRNDLMQERRLQQQLILNDEMMMMNNSNNDLIHSHNVGNELPMNGTRTAGAIDGIVHHPRQMSARLLKRRYRNSHDSGTTTSTTMSVSRLAQQQQQSKSPPIRQYNHHHYHQHNGEIQDHHSPSPSRPSSPTTAATLDSNLK